MRLVTAVSTRRLWEKLSMTARRKTSFTVRDIDSIAPMAAYRFNRLPRASTTAASPGRPTSFIRGANSAVSPSITGV
jgi:hypothetical protein